MSTGNLIRLFSSVKQLVLMLLLKKIFSATEVASELMEYILLLKTQSRVFCKTKHKVALVSIPRLQSDYHGTMTTSR